MRLDARVKELTLTNFGLWLSRHIPRVGSRTTIGSCPGDLVASYKPVPALHYFQLSSSRSAVVRSTVPQNLRANFGAGAAMVGILRHRICGHAGTRAPADLRARTPRDCRLRCKCWSNHGAA